MAIELKCPGCGRVLRVADQHAGKQARCPECQTVTTVPTPEQPAGGLGGEMPSSSPLTRPTSSSSVDPAAGAAISGAASSGGSAAGSSAGSSASSSAESKWQMKTPEGQIYGPVSGEDLKRWLAEGRLSRDCQLLKQGTMQWQWASAVFPALAGGSSASSGGGGASPSRSAGNPFSMSSDESREMRPTVNPYQGPVAPSSGAVSRGGYYAPHRGGLILTLGILSLVFGCLCLGLPLGLPAWIMGQSDLAAMKNGSMDPNGQGLTMAGMILGIIGTVLGALHILIFFLSAIAG